MSCLKEQCISEISLMCGKWNSISKEMIEKRAKQPAISGSSPCIAQRIYMLFSPFYASSQPPARPPERPTLHFYRVCPLHRVKDAFSDPSQISSLSLSSISLWDNRPHLKASLFSEIHISKLVYFLRFTSHSKSVPCDILISKQVLSLRCFHFILEQ